MSDQLSNDLAALRIHRDEEPAGGAGQAGRAVRAGRAVLVATLVLGFGGAAYVYGRPAAEARLFKVEVAVTEILRVSPSQAAVDLTATGYVTPERVAKVGSDVQGRITKVTVREGERVKVGQVLFEIDVADQRNQASTLRARAEAAQARAVAARAQAAEIRQQLDRDRPLAEREVIARAPVDDLQARLRTLDETAKAADADARAAGVDARGQADTLRHGTIHAPIDGTIVGKPPELGELLSPGGANLIEIVDLGSLVVEADVPEARLSRVLPGAPAEIVLDAYPDRRIRGKVREITPRVNRSKATVVVKVAFADPSEGALPEMSARVSFLSRALDASAMKEQPKIIVPAAAVADRNGGKVVFVVEGGAVRAREVTLGAAYGDGFELRSGPAPGTRVVKNPPGALSDGKSIKERNEG